MTIVNVLTKGWLFRVFILLLWSLAVGIKFFPVENRESSDEVSAVLLMIPCLLIFLTVGYRFMVLNQNIMAFITPNYYLKLKKSLAVIIFISLLPSFLLLPDFILLASALSWQLMLLAFCFFSFSRPWFWFVFSAFTFGSSFIFEGVSSDNLRFWLWQFPGYCLPIFVALTYMLLINLNKFKLSPLMKAKMLIYSGLTFSRSMTAYEKMPDESKTKWQQWLNKQNSNAYRNKLASKQQLNNRQLVEVAYSGSGGSGNINFVLASIIIVIFCVVHYIFKLPEGFLQLIFIGFFNMLAAGTVAMTSITQYLLISNRKEYLSRLRLMPRFKNDKDFNQSFLLVFFSKQMKMLLFTLISACLLIKIVWPDKLFLVSNIVIINVISFCVFSALVMFAWHTKKRLKIMVNFLMGISLLALYSSFLISAEQHYLLTDSAIFVGIVVGSFMLLLLSLAKWIYQVPSWQKVF